MASEPVKLEPAENIALTIARAQIARGENPPLNTTVMLVIALDRLTGAGGGEVPGGE